jgi:hypothetical protein
LGIAGKPSGDGFIQSIVVPDGHKGIRTNREAFEHVAGGGDISDVPDSMLAQALIENSSNVPGARFLVDAGNSNTFILRQVEPHGGYGLSGFVIKFGSPDNQIRELAVAEIMHRLGFPIVPFRMGGNVDRFALAARTGERGVGETMVRKRPVLVQEYGWNSHPLGGDLADDMLVEGSPSRRTLRNPSAPSPTFSYYRANFDDDDDGAHEERLANVLLQWLVNDRDNHSGNTLSARHSDGRSAVMGIDFGWAFQEDIASLTLDYSGESPVSYIEEVSIEATSVPPTPETHGAVGRSANAFLNGIREAVKKDPNLGDRLETMIVTMIKRFDKMFSDDSWINYLSSGGVYGNKFGGGVFEDASVHDEVRRAMEEVKALTFMRKMRGEEIYRILARAILYGDEIR